MSAIQPASVAEVVPRLAAGYIRESTEEQGQGWSPDAQRNAVEQYAATHGYTISEWYVDYVSGRDAAKRGDFKRLIDDAIEHKFQAVIAFHTSRFARNTMEARQFKKLLRKRLGIAVEFVSQQFGDPDDPSSFLAEGMSEIIDEYESLRIAFWVSHGLGEKKSQGYIIGMLPFGLVRPSPENTRDAVHHPEEAPIVEAIYVRYARGTESYGTIAGWLNSQGLRGRRGRPWSKDTVREVLCNATYVGYITPRRGVIDEQAVRGHFEPIISRELWEQVRAIREKRAVIKHGTYPAKRTYLLSGTVHCGACGARLRGISTGRKGNCPRYACANRVDRHSCQQPFALADILDEQISQFIETFKITSDRERQEILQLCESQHHDAERAAIGPSPEQIKRQLERTRDLYELGDYTRDDYTRRKAQLTRQLTEARPVQNLDRQRCIELLSNFGELWAKEKDPAERQQFIRLLFDRVVATDGRITEVVIRKENAPLFLSRAGFWSGSDGTRTRDLWRDRPAL